MTENSQYYGKRPQSGFEAQLRRLFELAGCASQAGLAEYLGVSHAAVSDALRRKTVPKGWLRALWLKKSVSPWWVAAGEGPRFLRSADGAAALEGFATDELLAELLRRTLRVLE